MFSRDSQISRDSKFTRDHPLDPPPKISTSPVAVPDASAVPTALSERPPERQSWQVATNIFSSFRYAGAGIAYAFRTQRNFRVHTCVGLLAMFLCWSLHVSTVEVAVICLTIGAVLVMEILNTALESLVDLTVGQTYHDLAKIAKDCAAGAVLMSAIVAVLVAALIFAPPLWSSFHPPLA